MNISESVLCFLHGWFLIFLQTLMFLLCSNMWSTRAERRFTFFLLWIYVKGFLWYEIECSPLQDLEQMLIPSLFTQTMMSTLWCCSWAQRNRQETNPPSSSFTVSHLLLQQIQMKLWLSDQKKATHHLNIIAILQTKIIHTPESVGEAKDKKDQQS